jgi:hypothetical protein
LEEFKYIFKFFICEFEILTRLTNFLLGGITARDVVEKTILKINILFIG